MDVIVSRRSVRQYQSRPVEPDKLNLVLRAGICAPSAHDSRPWKLVAVASPDGRERLRLALARRFREDMESAGFAPGEIARRLERSQGIFSAAPVLLVLFARVSTPDNPLAPHKGVEPLLTAQSVALAGGQMLLAAHSLGLGACWFAAPLFCPDDVCDACGMAADSWAPQGLITLGYPEGESREKRPPTLEESVLYL